MKVTDINDYIKILSFRRDGMQNLIKVNILAAKETIYYKIESNTVFKFFSD